MPEAIAKTTINANALCTMLRCITTNKAETTRTMAISQKITVAKSINNSSSLLYHATRIPVPQIGCPERKLCRSLFQFLRVLRRPGDLPYLYPGLLESPQSRTIGGCKPPMIFCCGACGRSPHAPQQKMYCPRRGREKAKRQLVRSPVSASD